MATYKNLPHHAATVSKTDAFLDFFQGVYTWLIRNGRVLLSLLAVIVIASLVAAYFANRGKRELTEVNREIYVITSASPETTADVVQKENAELQGLLQKYKSEGAKKRVHLAMVSNILSLEDPTVLWGEIEKSKEYLPEYASSLVTVSEVQRLWAEQKWDEARQKVASLKADGMLGLYPRYLDAEILEAAGKPQEALPIYEELSQKGSEDPLIQQKARGRLVLLKSPLSSR